jgi:hypothetical protein
MKREEVLRKVFEQHGDKLGKLVSVDLSGANDIDATLIVELPSAAAFGVGYEVEISELLEALALVYMSAEYVIGSNGRFEISAEDALWDIDDARAVILEELEEYAKLHSKQAAWQSYELQARDIYTPEEFEALRTRYNVSDDIKCDRCGEHKARTFVIGSMCYRCWHTRNRKSMPWQHIVDQLRNS